MHLVHYRESAWGARPGLNMEPDESGTVRDSQGAKAEYLVLHRSDDDEAGRFTMALIRYPEARSYPRHRHKTDQLRYVLRGAEPYGPQRVTPSGSLLYISSGTFYGPGKRDAGEEILSLEFYGADARFFVDEPIGPRGVMPQVRYASPVELNPGAFVWRVVGTGVREKQLATFTERVSRLSMLAIEPHASHRLTARQPMLCFVLEGSATAATEPLAARDSLRLAVGEAVELAVTSRLELLVIGMPSYSTN